MKQGKTLVALAQELTRISETAKDYIVPTERLHAVVERAGEGDDLTETVKVGFKNGADHAFYLNQWSAQQVATYTDIPSKYLERIRGENPSLAADSINHGFRRNVINQERGQAPEARMLRTLDGKVRGFVSSRFRALDSYDLLETILPVAQDNGMEVASSEVTEKRMFIKLLSPKLQSEVKKGDVVQYGLTISNSDVGAGSVRVEPLIYRLVCLNGMIANTSVRKYHVGRNNAEDSIIELLSDRTKEVSDAAFWMQVKDIVIASLRPENFEREVNRLRVAAEMPIRNFDLPEVVELTMKSVGIHGEGKKNGILAALATGNEGAGLTQWGLINSITRAAQAESISYEESIEMERAAGQVLELSPKDWKRIADSVAA